MLKRFAEVTLYVVVILQCIRHSEPKDAEEYEDPKQEQVVVRAVFIDCEPDEEQDLLGKEVTRFQREEMFKHSALQGCRKKLALTVKIASEPDKNSGDEYIPIEHVFDGSNQKRVRLLDPYILRLRRDSPLQAYKLRRIETVSGILTESVKRESINLKKNRVQRDVNEISKQKEFGPSSRPEVKQRLSDTKVNTGQQSLQFTNESNVFVKRDVCTFANNPAWKRERRHEHNIIVEDITDDFNVPWAGKDLFYRKFDNAAEFADNKGFVDNKALTSSKKEYEYRGGNDDIATPIKDEPKKHTHAQNDYRRTTPNSAISIEKYYKRPNEEITVVQDSTNFIVGDQSTRKFDKKNKSNHQNTEYEDTTEKKFEIFEIGDGDVWYRVNLQLFEKMTTLEGKTAWNDITKGEVASVSTMQPEWIDQDFYARYKPSEWTSKDEFTIPPTTNLCLLVPLHDSDSQRDDFLGLGTLGKYIVIPKDDIMGLEDSKNALNKRDRNFSDFTTASDSLRDEQGHRRVLIRVSRALLTNSDMDLEMTSVGADHFLTLPHQRPHHAQIDLEARADDNQLIRVGSSGSIINIVADNSRRKRCTITVQAKNKGLAAAKFRVKATDCGPDMASEGVTVGPILLPPRHTQKIIFELPTDAPMKTIHCSVALINDDEESVAVRDVAIKNGDRCFCVWHCDCVCLNDDPKLLCREMALARQVAAGLPPRERSRRARSVCYPDCVPINLFVAVIGVLMALLLLGAIKAGLGLFCSCTAKWGLDRLVKLPRKIDQYYESALEGRTVVYDEEGWPVHPDTKKRNVRLISKSMEFLLNLMFFNVLPCVMIRDAISYFASLSKRISGDCVSAGKDDNIFPNSHDVQRQHHSRRRRRGLRRWMTPHAEELSTNIWRKEVYAGKSIDIMRPLLHERRVRVQDPASSCIESEQEDTEYVLMQMQKSKESLAITQTKIFETEPSSARKLNAEFKSSYTVTR